MSWKRDQLFQPRSLKCAGKSQWKSSFHDHTLKPPWYWTRRGGLRALHVSHYRHSKSPYYSKIGHSAECVSKVSSHPHAATAV